MKNIYLLGATGSIGIQTLDVIRNNRDKFNLVTISSGRNIQKTREIIKEFNPKYVSVIREEDAKILRDEFNIEVGFGSEGLKNAAIFPSDNNYEDLVVTAVVGSVGLLPTLAAIKLGRNIAIANKETLVTAGHIVTKKAKEYNVKLLPVDSEHSAIFQCLNGEDNKTINKLIITASGGSFRDKTREDLKNVTVEDALKHPNWSMGAKITIDSASMMNKGLEVIEAHWLFGIEYGKIMTVLHRQSIVHSMVEFKDTSILAHLGTPDMRIPIQYALSYPERITLKEAKNLKIWEVGRLDFEPMDFNRFPNLKMAYDAGKLGGSMPTVLNAANEAAVSLFLNNIISFLDIEKIIYNELENHKIIKEPSLDDILSIDQEIKATVKRKYNL